MTAKAVAVLHRSMGIHLVELLLLFRMALVAQARNRVFQHTRKLRCMIGMARQAFSPLDWLMGDLMLRPALFLGMALGLTGITMTGITTTGITTTGIMMTGIIMTMIVMDGIMMTEVMIMALITKVGLPPIFRPFHLTAVGIVADAALIILQGLMNGWLPRLLQNLLVALVAALRFPDR